MLTRATLPQEFFDVTSDMLLVQPEPQYLHGLLVKMALAASLNVGDSLGVTADRAIASNGADYGTLESDRLVLSDPIYGEAIKVVPELGRMPGHTVRINRPAFTDTTYTQASREVPSGSTISTTPIDVSSEQTSITLKRFAGPYDQAKTQVAPYAIDKFDASLPIHSLVKIAGKHLKRDFDKFVDKVGVALFDQCSTIVRPTGFSADNDSTVEGDASLDFNTLSRTEKTLDEANIPTFANGHRAVILHPRQVQQLKDDAQFARYAQFDLSKSGINPVLSSSFVASVGKLDVFQSNTLSTSVNSSSVTIYRGQAFGPGMVGVGAGNLPHTTTSTADNYGEHALVIWLWYAGFVNLDQRFGVGIKTS